MARARTRLFAAIGACTMVAVVVSCSLGLDESKIQAVTEGGTVDVTPIEEAGVDAGDGGIPPVGPDGGTCAKDEDCATTNACLKGRCDLVAKRCIFDVCRPMACNVGACDTAAKTCGAPKPYTYKVTQFQVGAPVQRVAAIHPWLFVQTQQGVTAYNVSNPFGAQPNAAPPSKPVFGIGFVPTQMVATGNRVYFLTNPSGAANVPSSLPIAWLDVPSDPFAARLEAKNAIVTYSRPAPEGVVIAPRENDTALLVGPVAQNYPAAIVQPPIAEGATVTATPIVFPAGQALVAFSGERLLFQQYDGPTGTVTFGIVKGAGSPTPMNAGTYSYADAGPYAAPQSFGASVDGALFWSVASLNAPPPTVGAVTRAVRGHFLFPNGAGDYDRAATFDVEVYTNPAVGVGAQVAGPVAMLDAQTAMLLVAAKENPPLQTAIVFAKKNPLGLVMNADNTTPRRLVIPVPINTFVGAAATNGIGYAVANETMPNPNAMVYVFDPACPVQ